MTNETRLIDQEFEVRGCPECFEPATLQRSFTDETRTSAILICTSCGHESPDRYRHPSGAIDLKEGDIVLPNGAIERNGCLYACHVDCEMAPDRGYTPDGCVLQYGLPTDCDFGTYKNGQERKTRWTCPYWQKVSPELQDRVRSDQAD